LINLIAFYNEVLEEEKAADVVYFDFCKDFDTVSCNIIIDKQTKYR